MKRWWGQVDIRHILTTVFATAIISGFGYLWNKLEKVTVLESRVARIEDMLQEALDTKNKVRSASGKR